MLLISMLLHRISVSSTTSNNRVIGEFVTTEKSIIDNDTEYTAIKNHNISMLDFQLKVNNINHNKS